MKSNHKYLGNQIILDKYLDNFEKLKNGKGSIMLINGTKGIGKTRILEEFARIASNNGTTFASVKLPHPLGNIALSDLKPYSAFSLVLEDLARNKRSANLKLVSNVGLTLLASLPIAGDFFYATKEIKRDIKEYRKGVSKKESNNANFLEVFDKSAKKMNYIVFIDDFHFADVQSFGLLKDIISKEPELNIMFVITFDTSSTIRQIFSLKELLSFQEQNKSKVSLQNLQQFDDNLMKDAISDFFPNEILTNDIFAWFVNKTHKNPLALYKYLNYFDEFSIPLSKISETEIDKSVPEELHSLLMIQTNKLTEEEKNILSVCAIIGFEFPVSFVGSLMKTDILSTIRHLRSIQNRTGIITSIGVRNYFGDKVTYYQFSQNAYKEYFSNILEYEERKELQMSVTSLLKQIYDNTDDPYLKNSILPYLISHGIESENTELVEELLKTQIDIAKANDDTATLTGITSFLDKIKNPEIDEDYELMKESNLSDNVPVKDGDKSAVIGINYPSIALELAESNDNLDQIGIDKEKILNPVISFSWEDLVEMSLHQNEENIINNIENFLNFSKNETDRIRASLLLVKIHTEAERYSDAVKVLANLNYSVNHSQPTEVDILFLNAKAILEYKQGNVSQAVKILQEEAAPLSIKLGPELKLLTLSNIAIVLKNLDLAESLKYKQQVIKQSKLLKYDSFLEDFQKNYA